jgi:hypothetical protein
MTQTLSGERVSTDPASVLPVFTLYMKPGYHLSRAKECAGQRLHGKISY